MESKKIFIGTAAWNLPKLALDQFPREGSHLYRYSQVLNGVEINSCFYKDHLAKSYARWADLTPVGFKFSLKLHKRFTHDKELKTSREDLFEALRDMGELGPKWDVLLLQFPASLHFQRQKMDQLYGLIREKFLGSVVIEPRHPSWLAEDSFNLLKKHRLSKVVADPERCPVDEPRDWELGGLSYYRLHGSPEIYKSNYDESFLENLTHHLPSDEKVWCIFDNTTFGYATQNAVSLSSWLGSGH